MAPDPAGAPARPGAKKSCHERALGLLAVRARSRRELEQRLLAAGFDPDEVAETLERLERVGLVDDEAFARAFAEQRFGSRREGRRAVVAGLAGKGVAPSLVAEVVEDLADDEDARAAALAADRAARMRGVDPRTAYGRIVSLLVRRGYGPETARRAARSALDVDPGEE